MDASPVLRATYFPGVWNGGGESPTHNSAFPRILPDTQLQLQRSRASCDSCMLRKSRKVSQGTLCDRPILFQNKPTSPVRWCRLNGLMRKHCLVLSAGSAAGWLCSSHTPLGNSGLFWVSPSFLPSFPPPPRFLPAFSKGVTMTVNQNCSQSIRALSKA